MPTTRELQDQCCRGSVPSTQHVRDLPYRLKRQRTLDSSEPQSTAEPAAKRLALSHQLSDADSQYRLLNTSSSPIKNAERSTGNTVLSTQDIFGEYDDFDLDETLGTYSDDLLNASFVTDATSSVADQFCLGQSVDDAIEELIEMTPLDQHFQSPPTSVLKAQDRESRSAEEFDPTLQYSSPEESCTLSVTSHDEPVLKKEVDWQNVHEHAQKHTKAMSLVGSEEARGLRTTNTQQGANISASSMLAPSLPKLWVSKGFKDMRLTAHKTFFHLNEMLQAKTDMFKHQPDATFELFARVVYSSRENFFRKQYFQFRDLFKEAPPYLSGILQG